MGAILFSAGLAPVWQDTAYAGDGTCGEASADGSTAWYFAEGYTGPGFREWLCLFNPQESWADLDLHILYNQGPSLVEEIALPPRSRVTFDINALAGTDAEISLYLESSERVVAERPMYFTYRGAWKGCTVSSRAEALSDVWYFAEGCTRQGFETWLLLANPRETSVRATVRLILEDGTVTPVVVSLPPRSRRTVFVNDEVGSGRDVSARVEADAPICAERVMYFDYHGGWPGGHASSGLSQPRNIYLFAEGYTGAGFEEWLTLYAPRESGGADGTDVTLNCLFQGGEEQSLKVHLDPDRRHTLFINQLAGEGKDVSLELSADEPFLAERPMYFSYTGFGAPGWTGGHCVIGSTGTAGEWFFAEGYTGGGFQEWLCLQNPGDEVAAVQIDYFTQEEGHLAPRVVDVPARTRLNVRVNDNAGPGYQLSCRVRVLLGSEIVVERPMYFSYGPGWSGGHDVVGLHR